MDLSIQAFGAIVYDSNGVIFGVKIEKLIKSEEILMKPLLVI